MDMNIAIVINITIHPIKIMGPKPHTYINCYEYIVYMSTIVKYFHLHLKVVIKWLLRRHAKLYHYRYHYHQSYLY